MESSYGVFETSDIEEAMDFRFVAEPRWENTRRREKFHYRLYYAHLSKVGFGYLESRSWLRYRGALEESYLVLIPDHGHVRHVVRGIELMLASPARGILHSPGWEIQVDTEPRKCWGLTIPRALVLEEARKRLDREVDRLDFDPELDLTEGAGATFHQLVRLIHTELSRPDGLRPDSRALEHLELSLVELLLDAHPFTVPSPSTDIPDGGPGVVRRVDELIRATVDGPLTVGDLAAHVGVSSRTLFRTYRRYRGRSPIQALREVRLGRARRDLLVAGPGTNVTEVAVRCGFKHLGRFAEVYKRAFGESPSETLRSVRKRDRVAARSSSE